jgi:hypothetical protein
LRRDRTGRHLTRRDYTGERGFPDDTVTEIGSSAHPRDAGTWLASLVRKARGEEPKPADSKGVRLYIPIPQLEERLGKDAKPVTNYLQALEKRAAEVLRGEEPPEAKGLLVAVGVKSRTRVWHQPVDGSMPGKLLRRLEKELARVKVVDLEKPPFAFALHLGLFGRTPFRFFAGQPLPRDRNSETALLLTLCLCTNRIPFSGRALP